MEHSITYVGLDVQKDTVALSAAEPGKRGKVREDGKIANTPIAVRTLVAKLTRDGDTLRFCYGAGPCGYGIQRQLTAAGHECVVEPPTSALPATPPAGSMQQRRSRDYRLRPSRPLS